MTDWKEQTAEELMTDMENEILRRRNSKMPRTLPPLIITKDLYDRLNTQEERGA